MVSQISLEYVLFDNFLTPEETVSKVRKHQVIIMRISDSNLAEVVI